MKAVQSFYIKAQGVITTLVERTRKDGKGKYCMADVVACGSFPLKVKLTTEQAVSLGVGELVGLSLEHGQYGFSVVDTYAPDA